MRLIFTDPERPPEEHSDDLFVLTDRVDGGEPVVRNGEAFEVADDQGRFLLARYFPAIQPAGPGA